MRADRRIQCDESTIWRQDEERESGRLFRVFARLHTNTCPSVFTQKRRKRFPPIWDMSQAEGHGRTMHRKTINKIKGETLVARRTTGIKG